MSATPRDSPNAPAAASELNSLCARFQDALRCGKAGPLEAWLPAGGPARAAALIELVRLEFEHRVQAGEPVSAEDYFARYPELRSDPALAARVQATVQRPARNAPPAPTPDLKNTTSDPSAEPAGRRLSGQFGRYRIVKVLGHGGMGVVYHAYDTQLDRPVALKVMRFGGGNPELVERFFREARIAASFTHPNLCPVHDFSQKGGVYYLTMPLIGGEPLSAYLKREGCLPGPAAARLAATVARAVHEAHQAGIVHRDLKPANVMMNERRQPVVMDFGLARRVGPLDPRMTAPGALLGTPAYMAPEQIAGGSDACGPAQDVYSLGVLLYEMLTGRLPFEGAVNEVLAQALTAEPTPPSRRRPDLDPRLERICLTAMARNPNGRYPSMEAFAEALEAYAEAGERPAAVPAATPVKEPRPARRLRGAPLWLGACLLLAIVAIAIGAAAWFAWPHPTPIAPPPAAAPTVDNPTDPFQRGSTWYGSFRWEGDDSYHGRVKLVVERRTGNVFEGDYIADGGDYDWSVRGTIVANNVEWQFTEIRNEKDPKKVVGVAAVEGVIRDGNRLDADYKDSENRAHMSLRLMK